MPFGFVFWVRVSFVWSPTIVTTVSGSTPPVLSVTVPVMPPRVCCAWACEENANGIQKDAASARAASPVLLSISNLPQVYKCARADRPLSGQMACLPGPASRMSDDSTRVSYGIKVSLPVKISLGRIRYFYRSDGFAVLGLSECRIFTAAANREPQQSCGQIGKIDVRQFSVRSCWHWIEISHQREQHGKACQPRNDLHSATIRTTIAQVARQRYANQSVGHNEAVGRQRAHPAIDIQPAGAACCQWRHGKQRSDASNDHRTTWSLIPSMCIAQRTVGKAAVGHLHQHPGRCRDARQSSGEQTDESANIDQQSQHGYAANRSQHIHWSLARAQILANGMESQHLSIGADCEESPGENCTLNDSAWNRVKRIARFRSQRGRTLEANEAEQRQHQSQPKSAAGH